MFNWSYLAAIPLAAVGCYVALLPLYYYKKWLAIRARDEKIPVSGSDCFKDYRRAIRHIKRRWSAASPLYIDRSEVGLDNDDDLTEFYPVIAFYRFCHLRGYEVEIRPMQSEDTPAEEGEIICRLTDKEYQDLLPKRKGVLL